jgi:hypothetical protein
MANPQEVSLDQYSWLENESIQFVESMGFMLDNLGFRARPPQDQLAMLEAFPFLREQQQRLAGSLPQSSAGMVLPPEETPPQRLAVARLLASF